MSAQLAQLVLITGISGAGRSTALRTLEDFGFEAVDNLPLGLLARLASSLRVDGAGSGKPLAVGIDIRNRDFDPDAFMEELDRLQMIGLLKISVLFIDSDDETLIRRYKESRRPHPLTPDRQAADGLKLERHLLEPLRGRADIVIDTTSLTPWQLKERLKAIFDPDQAGMGVTFMSFGFKNGVPRETDLMFDVRFLQNPHYDPELRPLTGLDKPVGDAVSADADFDSFLERLQSLLTLTLPRYEQEGKSHLTVAIGCTGGRHRSVFITETMAKWLDGAGNWPVHVYHRDLPVDEAGAKDAGNNKGVGEAK